MKQMLLSFLCVCLFFTIVQKANAHVGSGPPFLKINGTYSATNPYYQGPSAINVPQDTTSQVFLPGDKLSMEIVTSQLTVPPDIAAKTVFRWQMYSGENFSQKTGSDQFGTTATYTFSKPGSYLLTVEAKAPGSTENLIIDTVQLDVVPSTTYKLPKASVFVGADTLKSGAAMTFVAKSSIDRAVKHTTALWDFGDNTIQKGLTLSHTFSDWNFFTYVYMRVVDDRGLVNDIGFNAQGVNGTIKLVPFGNMQTVPLSFGTPDQARAYANQKNTALSAQNQTTIYFVLGAIFILVLVIIVLVLRKIKT
ncbi:MAG TPA: PKD domain-containing protein [Candidatus Saccharimonadales bacterium]|nr:PKD domain-containing protein [Candidatus Saccharimonadales bacterium]